MKKMILAGMTCVVLLLVVCTAGCINMGSDSIVGSWYSQDEYYSSGVYYDLKYVFDGDGTGTEYWYLSYSGKLDDTYDFTWKNVGNGEYLVSFVEPFYLSGSTLYDDYDITYYKK